MTAHAFIVGRSNLVLWGLDGRQRLERQLRRAGIRLWDELPEGVPLMLLRADFVYDDRVIRALAAARDVLLMADTVSVAAHVRAELARDARDALATGQGDSLPGVSTCTPETLSRGYQAQLRKADPPYVLPAGEDRRAELEARLFAGAYKGVTDLVTKWLWPAPARAV